MQRVAGNHIRDAKILHEWSKDAFNTIDFDFFPQKDHDTREKKYSKRLNEAIDIKKTRQFHHFEPATHKKIRSKKFSHDTTFFECVITH